MAETGATATRAPAEGGAPDLDALCQVMAEWGMPVEWGEPWD